MISRLAREFDILPDVLTLKQHLAGGRLQQAVEMLDERGFTGAGVADQADELTALNAEGDIMERCMLKWCPGTVDMGQILYL